MKTSELRRKADRRLIPLPDYDDDEMWHECHYVAANKVLTTKSITVESVTSHMKITSPSL